MKCRKRMNDVKTGEESLPRDQRWGEPLTASVASGIKVARVRSWLEHGTWEPVASMPREKPKWKPHEGQSTDAGHRGGWARSSDEVPVMGMERRGPITQLRRGVNRAIGRNPSGKRDRWSGDKSRMSREAPVRFREGLGVKFPRATRRVVQARYQTRRLIDWIEGTLEGRFGLTVNREKTRIVKVRTPDASLNFLGFTLRYDRDRYGRDRRYLNVVPSEKAQARIRDELRELTRRQRGCVPITQVIADVNRCLVGWGNYFRHGYPRQAFGKLDWFVLNRLTRHLKRRSQRPVRPPEGKTYYALLQSLGLQRLRASLC
jgi:hypothetical protein